MTYGNGILGVSCFMLRGQRRIAAAIVAPSSGRGSENLDAALILADGGPKGYADPAFDAHLLPIGQWAEAVWEERMPKRSLQRLVSKGTDKLDKARSPWAVCKGPGAAFVASCRRLWWKVIDAVTLTTDDGKRMQLLLDFPAAVAYQAKLAV